MAFVGRAFRHRNKQIIKPILISIFHPPWVHDDVVGAILGVAEKVFAACDKAVIERATGSGSLCSFACKGHQRELGTLHVTNKKKGNYESKTRDRCKVDRLFPHATRSTILSEGLTSKTRDRCKVDGLFPHATTILSEGLCLRIQLCHSI
jgi:hypothetical protein